MVTTGSEIGSSNKQLSYALLNRKTRLCDTGTLIQSASKAGAGQEAYCTSTSAGLIRGVELLTDPTNVLWETKLGRLLFGTKWGSFMPSTSTMDDNTDGILDGTSATGTLGIGSLDTTYGLPSTFTTAATIGAQTGVNRSLLYTVRSFNPSIKLTWKTDEAAANIRFYCGWTSSTSIIGNSNDPLNAVAGFGIAMDTGQTNYRIYHNDVTGATVSDDTGIAKSTGYHTIELWGDSNGNGFWWSLDNSTGVQVTTDIPSSTQGLSCQFICTAVDADAKVMSVQKFIITSDK